ncbi:hypothetical protein [Neobacillus sp. YIM B06451]|uniref:hypothetical protein n=1 Tax=Neobacillus sp. YIM B06451 TaxID=3070994 RepID=UPI00292D9FC7|nr:hypothetical protein [Neobacillus sp. YIM B06451]
MFKIQVNGKFIEIQENQSYFIEVEDRTFKGIIVENMVFVYDNRVFFYILTDEDNEEYQIVEDEIVSIKRL